MKPTYKLKMPETRAPLDIVATSYDSDTVEYEKADSVRSSSPKSDSSVASDSLSLEFSDVSSDETCPSQDILIDELEHLKLDGGAESTEEMVRAGADMRHVLSTTWKLQSKITVDKKLNSKSSGMFKNSPGQALRDMAEAQKLAIEEHEMAAKYSRAGKVRPPPGFEKTMALTAASDQPAPILVSYADGSNTMTLTNEALTVHNVTVASAVDSCHVFIKQMQNPTHAGLAPLEEAMFDAYQNEEAPLTLFRPIATGSLLAVNTDDKWYRCQVVSFDKEQDVCEVKFVDHGGYTTVPVDELRQLRSDFVQLPFQAIEVYIAHIIPASDEIEIDIAADILFRDDVSLQLIGLAEDGIPVVQAYFYLDGYINLLTQDILDEAQHIYMKHHPDYVPTPIISSSSCSLASSETGADSIIDEFPTLEESMRDSGSGSWTPDDSSLTCAEDLYHQQNIVYMPSAPISPEGAVVIPENSAYPSEVAWVPVQQPMLAYYVPDPNTGVLYCVTTPLVPATPVYASVPEVSPQSVDLESKPYDEWTQEDYEVYYSQLEQ